MGRENQDKGRRAVPKERHIRTHSHSDLFFDKVSGHIDKIANIFVFDKCTYT